MLNHFRLAAISATVLLSPLTQAADAEHGKELYQALCSSCHSIPYNGTGPAHQGLFGRKAGGRDDYQYSEALKASTIVWNEATLDAWLADPEKAVPGQKMGPGVPSAQDRADLIAYLKLASGK